MVPRINISVLVFALILYTVGSAAIVKYDATNFKVVAPAEKDKTLLTVFHISNRATKKYF